MAEVGTVQSIEFGLMGDQELRQLSILEIRDAADLSDPRLGVSLKQKGTCGTCDGKADPSTAESNCPGHWGHIELVFPVFFPHLIPKVTQVLLSFCVNCRRRLSRKVPPPLLNFNGHRLQLRPKAGRRAAERVPAESSEGDESDGGEVCCEDSVKESAEAKVLQFRRMLCAVCKKRADVEFREDFDAKAVQRLFKKITDEEWRGFKPRGGLGRPEWLVHSVLLVPPPHLRIAPEWASRLKVDHITRCLRSILAANKKLKQLKDAGKVPDVFELERLQPPVNSFFRAAAKEPESGTAEQRKARAPTKKDRGILDLIQPPKEPKEGHVALLKGKRSDYSGRSVISPAADVSVTAVEVPREMGLRKTERVTSLNLPRLQGIFERSIRAARGLLERDEPLKECPEDATEGPSNDGTATRAGEAFETGRESEGDQNQRTRRQSDRGWGAGEEKAAGQRNGRTEMQRKEIDGTQPEVEGWGGGNGCGEVGGAEKQSSDEVRLEKQRNGTGNQRNDDTGTQPEGDGGTRWGDVGGAEKQRSGDVVIEEQRNGGQGTERNQDTGSQLGWGGGTGWGGVGDAGKQRSVEAGMDEQRKSGTETKRNADLESQPVWGGGSGWGNVDCMKEADSADGDTTESPQKPVDRMEVESGRGRRGYSEAAAEGTAWKTERSGTGWQETDFNDPEGGANPTEAERPGAREPIEEHIEEQKDIDCAQNETNQGSAGKSMGEDKGGATGWGEPGAWGAAVARDDVSNPDDVSNWQEEAPGEGEEATGWGVEEEKLVAERNERSGEDGWGKTRAKFEAPGVWGDSQRGMQGEGVAKKGSRGEERVQEEEKREKARAPNRPVRPFDGQIVQFRRNGTWRKVALVSPGQFELRVGDVIERLLTEGDLVLWNRNPSVRQHNLLASRVKLTDCKTIGLPLPLCHACNGDFDGDEMNLHVPQGPEACAEAQELLLTSANVTSTQKGQALVALWQDSRLGVFLMLTSGRKGAPVDFTRADACQLVVGIPDEASRSGGSKKRLQFDPPTGTEADGGEQTLLPDPPARRKLDGEPVYTADQILCAALPDGFTYASEEDGVRIARGRAEFYGARMGATWLGEAPDGLVATLWRMYGAAAAVRFLDAATHFTRVFLDNRGFSLGLEDLLITPSRAPGSSNRAQNKFEQIRMRALRIAIRCVVKMSAAEPEPESVMHADTGDLGERLRQELEAREARKPGARRESVPRRKRKRTVLDSESSDGAAPPDASGAASVSDAPARLRGGGSPEDDPLQREAWSDPDFDAVMEQDEVKDGVGDVTVVLNAVRGGDADVSLGEGVSLGGLSGDADNQDNQPVRQTGRSDPPGWGGTGWDGTGTGWGGTGSSKEGSGLTELDGERIPGGENRAPKRQPARALDEKAAAAAVTGRKRAGMRFALEDLRQVKKLIGQGRWVKNGLRKEWNSTGALSAEESRVGVPPEGSGRKRKAPERTASEEVGREEECHGPPVKRRANWWGRLRRDEEAQSDVIRVFERAAKEEQALMNRHVPPGNAFRALYEAGSKGSPANLQKMALAQGLQLWEGRALLPMLETERFLPHLPSESWWASRFDELSRGRSRLVSARALPGAFARQYREEARFAAAYFEAHKFIRTPLVSGARTRADHFFAQAMAERHSLVLKGTGNDLPYSIGKNLMFHLGDLTFDELGMVTSADGHVVRFPSTEWDGARAKYSKRVGARTEPEPIKRTERARARGARGVGVLLDSPSKVPFLGLERKKFPTPGTEWWYDEDSGSEEGKGQEENAPGERWGEDEDGMETQKGGEETDKHRSGGERGSQEGDRGWDGNEDGWKNTTSGWTGLKASSDRGEKEKSSNPERVEAAQGSETLRSGAPSASAEDERKQDLPEVSSGKTEQGAVPGSVSARSDGALGIETEKLSDGSQSIGAALACVTNMVQNDVDAVNPSDVTKMETGGEGQEGPVRAFGTRPRPRRLKVTRRRKRSVAGGVGSGDNSSPPQKDASKVRKRKNFRKTSDNSSSEEDPEWMPNSGSDGESEASGEEVSGSALSNMRGGGTERAEGDEFRSAPRDGVSDELTDVLDAVDDVLKAMDEVSNAGGAFNEVTQPFDGAQTTEGEFAKARADSGGKGDGEPTEKSFGDPTAEETSPLGPEAECETEPMQSDPCDDENPTFGGIPDVPAEGTWDDGIPGTWGFPEAGDAVGAAAAHALAEPLAQGVLDAVKRPGGGVLDVARRDILTLKRDPLKGKTTAVNLALQPPDARGALLTPLRARVCAHFERHLRPRSLEAAVASWRVVRMLKEDRPTLTLTSYTWLEVDGSTRGVRLPNLVLDMNAAPALAILELRDSGHVAECLRSTLAAKRRQKDDGNAPAAYELQTLAERAEEMLPEEFSVDFPQVPQPVEDSISSPPKRRRNQALVDDPRRLVVRALLGWWTRKDAPFDKRMERFESKVREVLETNIGGSSWVASATAAPARAHGARGLTVTVERPPKPKIGANKNGEMSPAELKQGLRNYEREYLQKVPNAQEQSPLGLAFLAVAKVPPFRHEAGDDSGGRGEVGGTGRTGKREGAESGSRRVWPKSFFNSDSEEEDASDEEASVKDGSGRLEDLQTEGLDIDASELMDPFRSRPEDCEDVAESLGIEAAQAALVEDLQEVYGDKVDRKHLELVADKMTASGKVLSLNMNGYKEHRARMKLSIPPLSRAIYRKENKSAPKILTDAAYAGQRDALTQPSARAGLGLPVASGTGGGFALLPNPRAARAAVPQERIAQARAAQERAATSGQEKQQMGDQEQVGDGIWSPGKAMPWRDGRKTGAAEHANRDGPETATGWGAPAESDRNKDPGSGWDEPVEGTGWDIPREPKKAGNKSGTGWNGSEAPLQRGPAKESDRNRSPEDVSAAAGKSNWKEDPGSGWGDPVEGTGWNLNTEPAQTVNNAGTGWKSVETPLERGPANESGWGNPVGATGWGISIEPHQVKSPANRSGTGWNTPESCLERRPGSETGPPNVPPEHASAAAEQQPVVSPGGSAPDETARGACTKEEAGSGWGSPAGWGAEELEGGHFPEGPEERAAEGGQNSELKNEGESKRAKNESRIIEKEKTSTEVEEMVWAAPEDATWQAVTGPSEEEASLGAWGTGGGATGWDTGKDGDEIRSAWKGDQGKSNGWERTDEVARKGASVGDNHGKRVRGAEAERGDSGQGLTGTAEERSEKRQRPEETSRDEAGQGGQIRPGEREGKRERLSGHGSEDDPLVTDLRAKRNWASTILRRYEISERLSPEDQQFVLEELLAYHEKAAEKIGCGVEAIKVDRAPKGQSDRCFHVLRTDGSSEDFSFRKCLVNRAAQAGANGDQMQGLTTGWAGRFRPPGDEPAKEHSGSRSVPQFRPQGDQLAKEHSDFGSVLRFHSPADGPAKTHPTLVSRFRSPTDPPAEADPDKDVSRVIPPREAPASESPGDVSRFMPPGAVSPAGADPDHLSPVGPSKDQPASAPESDHPEPLRKPPEVLERSRDEGAQVGSAPISNVS
ncbi:putative DNA-directed RNA polymerase large subunit [Klebsormidium nitens]|uniref:DNA-directed RNA polymerase subunit n=1 Tax=Klebsormidium nitens TaxID=105231 RepID=A0A1Y1HU34_KLENI|nr:putative DNA-directed RNA polymerase large subunit [Klebsormidium nitens]|eukprot:GAQ80511.1 putative DNA-directed RNA polymerase large subunit [Klebsormidium nitens]